MGEVVQPYNMYFFSGHLAPISAE